LYSSPAQRYLKKNCHRGTEKRGNRNQLIEKIPSSSLPFYPLCASVAFCPNFGFFSVRLTEREAA